MESIEEMNCDIDNLKDIIKEYNDELNKMFVKLDNLKDQVLSLSGVDTQELFFKYIRPLDFTILKEESFLSLEAKLKNNRQIECLFDQQIIELKQKIQDLENAIKHREIAKIINFLKKFAKYCIAKNDLKSLIKDFEKSNLDKDNSISEVTFLLKDDALKDLEEKLVFIEKNIYFMEINNKTNNPLISIHNYFSEIYIDKFNKFKVDIQLIINLIKEIKDVINSIYQIISFLINSNNNPKTTNISLKEKIMENEVYKNNLKIIWYKKQKTTFYNYLIEIVFKININQSASEQLNQNLTFLKKIDDILSKKSIILELNQDISNQKIKYKIFNNISKEFQNIGSIEELYYYLNNLDLLMELIGFILQLQKIYQDLNIQETYIIKDLNIEALALKEMMNIQEILIKEIDLIKKKLNINNEKISKYIDIKILSELNEEFNKYITYSKNYQEIIQTQLLKSPKEEYNLSFSIPSNENLKKYLTKIKDILNILIKNIESIDKLVNEDFKNLLAKKQDLIKKLIQEKIVQFISKDEKGNNLVLEGINNVFKFILENNLEIDDIKIIGEELEKFMEEKNGD
ncbi:MAG: hypothetical protein ACTSVV_03710 [Promethearchaeota archaeon]